MGRHIRTQYVHQNLHGNESNRHYRMHRKNHMRCQNVIFYIKYLIFMVKSMYARKCLINIYDVDEQILHHLMLHWFAENIMKIILNVHIQRKKTAKALWKKYEYAKSRETPQEMGGIQNKLKRF